eukprot:gnl/MRDRNA2_/MRDRNA2_89505_c0_seq1.p1 gnl/MRDRNA2_/MRDRNA2_89505_c0~~gnl/MRDRNA2_/MRDRNA2_89505_c0_seq1.p1  ORF type:complete len:387 (-),score=126.66 gnl/MRDRNA2_/MRDRNA2_89505_c0_seq1:21-1142(-)
MPDGTEETVAIPSCNTVDDAKSTAAGLINFKVNAAADDCAVEVEAPETLKEAADALTMDPEAQAKDQEGIAVASFSPEPDQVHNEKAARAMGAQADGSPEPDQVPDENAEKAMGEEGEEEQVDGTPKDHQEAEMPHFESADELATNPKAQATDQDTKTDVVANVDEHPATAEPAASPQEHAAATRVQSLQRGRNARKQTAKMRQKLVTEGSSVGGSLDQESAAIRIQSMHRGRKARKRTEGLIRKRQESILSDDANSESFSDDFEEEEFEDYSGDEDNEGNNSASDSEDCKDDGELVEGDDVEDDRSAIGLGNEECKDEGELVGGEDVECHSESEAAASGDMVNEHDEESASVDLPYESLSAAESSSNTSASQ